jgi:hypothetical protein
MKLSEAKIYLETILNKHSSGNTLSPKEYNSLLEAHIFSFVQNAILEQRRYVLQGTPMDDAVYTSLLLNSLQKAVSPSLSSGTFPLPADYLSIVDMWAFMLSGSMKKLELISPEEYGKRISNQLSKPISYYPVAYLLGGSMYYYPTNISSITLNYFSKPDVPLFDYYIDANYNIVPLDASETHLLTTGEYGSAGQTAGTTVTSLTTELSIPESTHQKFFDYMVGKIAMRDSNPNLYQAAINEEGK